MREVLVTRFAQTQDLLDDAAFVGCHGNPFLAREAELAKGVDVGLGQHIDRDGLVVVLGEIATRVPHGSACHPVDLVDPTRMQDSSQVHQRRDGGDLHQV